MELNGRHVTRARSDQAWSYRFQVSGYTFKGSTQTTDKAEAEAIAEKFYRDAKAAKVRAERFRQINAIIGHLESKLQTARSERARLLAQRSPGSPEKPAESVK